jgi:hypothetical protein
MLARLTRVFGAMAFTALAVLNMTQGETGWGVGYLALAVTWGALAVSGVGEE